MYICIMRVQMLVCSTKMKSRELTIAIIFLIFLRIDKREGTKLSCGARQVKNSAINDEDSLNNRWPWHAAIYHVVKEQGTTTGSDENDYKCGGTLINSNTLLTTAFCVCVLNGNQPMDLESVVVWLGKLDLKSVNEEGSQYFHVILILFRLFQVHLKNNFIETTGLQHISTSPLHSNRQGQQHRTGSTFN